MAGEGGGQERGTVGSGVIIFLLYGRFVFLQLVADALGVWGCIVEIEGNYFYSAENILIIRYPYT